MPRRRITSFTPSSDDNFFFDNNIWIFITDPYGETGGEKESKYTDFFSKILQSQSKIKVSSLILSEYFNVVLRRKFNVLREQSPSQYRDFKRHFKGTEDYKETMNKIVKKVNRQILRVANRVDDSFKDISTDELFTNIEEHDYNDKCILELCKRENLILLSDDRDMNDEDVTVLYY